MVAVYNYILSTGVIVPDTSTLLAEVQSEYTAVFGTDLVISPDSPQGVLMSAEALARADVVKINAALANQINPNIAGGVALDAIGMLSGIQRTAQTQTVVTNVNVNGIAGTIIPEGSQAQTAAGDIFATLSQVTLDGTGTAMVNFAAIEYGPIPCATDALNQVVSDVLGWETVDNTSAGATTPGATTQSDQQYRAYRNNTLAFQGVALPVAITSALYATTGVTSLTFQENVAATTETINGITMVPHSIYVCVAGGSDTAVAAALLENKSSGCAWNGSTSVNVTEPASGQLYEVKFDRPNQIDILVKIITPNGDAQAVTQAVLDYAAGLVQITDQNGNNGILPGFVVGGDVSPFEIAGAVMAENPGIYIASVQIGLAPAGGLSSNPIPIAVDEQAATQVSYITVSVS